MDKGTGIFTQNTKRKSMILKHARKIPEQPGLGIARLAPPPGAEQTSAIPGVQNRSYFSDRTNKRRLGGEF